MSVANVLIVTPAPPGSRAGNRHTATRWSGILRHLGCRVGIRTEWSGQDCDVLVALHARKSHHALLEFRQRHPHRPALLALTGTDLYRDIRENPEAAASLELATRLIVLQEAALDELTPSQRDKARVIHQSVTTTLTYAPPFRTFRICVLGHLREEKDPFCTVRALNHIPDAGLEVRHAGKALSQAMQEEAERHMQQDPRYRWLGELAHGESMRLLSRSHLMVISSALEGGAHVVSEAIALGTPVIASDIPGNRGLLGADYPGCFPVGDAAELARLLLKARNEADFLARLAASVRSRRALVDATRERLAWHDLLRELGFTPHPIVREPAQSCAGKSG